MINNVLLDMFDYWYFLRLGYTQIDLLFHTAQVLEASVQQGRLLLEASVQEDRLLSHAETTE